VTESSVGSVGAVRPAPRSHLYVPGDKPEVLAKALGRGADALIVDLEDAVAIAAKDSARAIVADWLATLPAAADNAVEIWVRVNPGELRSADVAAIVCPALTGICLAKTETAGEVAAVAAEVAVLEPERGVADGAIRLAPLLESAAAVLRALEIAEAPRVARLQVGEADLRADIGVELGADERELLWVRSQVVLASAAAGIAPPVGPVSTNFRDLDALAESTRALARLGYRGRACIHPAQAAVVNEVFTPDSEKVAAARSLIERFDAAVAAGDGVMLDENGRMVDEAVIRQARRLLEFAR
jgi:citrate lyase subunit beta/citryl-CoA lyase